jgi:hypothetical protein
MNIRGVLLLLLVVFVLSSCQTNNLSNIPKIGLISFGPPYITINQDTCEMQFTIEDGNADLGNPKIGNNFDIYIKDFRFDTGYAGYFFPDIDGSIKDPEKGFIGTCYFYFTPYILLPRTDSLHMATGDTTYFEVYVVDQAGNESNHFVTPKVILTY